MSKPRKVDVVVQKYVCTICLNEYDSLESATNCQEKGIPFPCYKIGDTCSYNPESRKTPDLLEVVDILLPNYGFDHDYRVSYLLAKRDGLMESQFFPNNVVDYLRNFSVLDEWRMFDAEGKETEPSKNGSYDWKEYIKYLRKKNPKAERSIGLLEAKLKGTGHI